jgi:hypothetical protein
MAHSHISSSSSYHRLVTVISIILLNPLPFIYGVPTEKIDNNFKLSRHKRPIDFNDNDINLNNNDFTSEQGIIFEGLLGLINMKMLKYEKNFCINRVQIRFKYMQSI